MIKKVVKMKKSLFGYKVSEVNTILNSLKEENKSLHSTITALKLKIERIDVDSNAKSILLEEDLKTYEENLININKEKNDLEKKLNSLMKENEYLLKQLSELGSKSTKEVDQVDDDNKLS